jgi:hypothetical protein
MRQNWKNAKFRYIRLPKDDTNEPASVRQDVAVIRSKVKELDDMLVKCDTYAIALQTWKRARRQFEVINLDTTSTRIRRVTQGALDYCDYMLRIWLQPNLFMAWSYTGRKEAAHLLQMPLSSILNTTNHLESFNNVLKNSLLIGYKKNGHRLRLDIFVCLLIHRIIPEIFRTRVVLSQQANWKLRIHRR